MTVWGEVLPDLVLCSLYVYLLLRVWTAPEKRFHTPFYTFFISTGIYSIITVITYQFINVFNFTELYWTYHFYKPLIALNAFGSVGGTFGKAAIAVHRYFVMRRRDFAEKTLLRPVIVRVLVAQFVLSLLETVSIWPASFTYTTVNGIEYILSISDTSTLIQKGLAVSNYVLYVICNSIFSVLTSRELYRMREMLEDKTPASRKILVQQRRLFIVVTVCSISHLIKALHQVRLFLLISG
ncbi:hypothetical protein PMAYCL1PPCAC_28277 [Pristionchus mayeri]|uniref:G protein-coupled receptor n=1 Tax=Pristionchus mayeri TaxID=1317129 RepID=A0AAN5D7C2_9BILA|nr:hypothetical protein PMAYCL1PPCAC_28277 [Pristionchus mayeri]